MKYSNIRREKTQILEQQYSISFTCQSKTEQISRLNNPKCQKVYYKKKYENLLGEMSLGKKLSLILIQMVQKLNTSYVMSSIILKIIKRRHINF